MIFLWSRRKFTMFVTGLVVICTKVPFALMKGETWVL